MIPAIMTKKDQLDTVALRASEAQRARFWAKVVKGDKCWEWGGYISPAGYGKWCLEQRKLLAHRVAKLWERTTPQIGLFCCHSCNNPKCVRPSHLYFGTNQQNLGDSRVAGSANYLTWVAENHPRSVLTNEKARGIYQEALNGGMSARNLAQKHNVALGTVKTLLQRRSYSSALVGLPKFSRDTNQFALLQGTRHARAILNEEKVKAIRHLFKNRISTVAQLASEHGVAIPTIRSVLKRKTWRHVS